MLNKLWQENIEHFESKRAGDFTFISTVVSKNPTVYWQDKIYSKYAEYAYEWFFGRNRQNKVLYNFNMECCYDGLDEQGVSNNNGAESTICFVLAVLSFRKHTLLIIDKETE